MSLNNESSAPRTSATLPRTFVWIFLVAIVVLAGFVRFYRLGGPQLWGDEILFLRMCHPGLSVIDVIRQHLQSFGYIGHLPATAALSNLGMVFQGLHSIGDITPFAARLPSAVLGFLSILVFAWWLWRITRTTEIALVGLTLGAFSYIHIWHSQDAYYYAGQLFFMIMMLLYWSELAREEHRKSSWLWMGYVTSLIMLAFSHPAGIALIVPLSLATLVLASLHRQHWRRYVIMASIGLAICVVLAFMAGPPGAKAPWTDTYRYSIWVVAADVLDYCGFGPSNLRLALFCIVLIGGVATLLHRRNSITNTLLVLIPLVFTAVHVGGMSRVYAPKYFLLLWPLLMAIAAIGLGRLLLLLDLRLRVWGLALLALTAAANITPPLLVYYQLKGRWNCFETLLQNMEKRLDAGTLCVWDGGHATRFIPGFYVAKKPFIYGGLPDPYAASFVNRSVYRQLQNLRAAFPSVAYIEWGGVSEPYEIRFAGGKEKRDLINKEIAGLFPHCECPRDPALRTLALSGWYPGIPRFADDYALREECMLDHGSMKLYYASAIECGSLATPIFDPQTWQLLFTRDDRPILIGSPQAAFLLEQNLGPYTTNGAILNIQITTMQEGELDILANRVLLHHTRIEQAGTGGTITIPWNGERLVVEFHFRVVSGTFRGDIPSYGITGISVRPAPPSPPPKTTTENVTQ